jgi:catabolite regulation protein CreA
MSVTIGSNTYALLDAQPAGYDGKDTERGFTVRKWTVSGCLTETEWTGMVSAYDTWRNTRIAEGDSLLLNAVGTTVSLTSTEPPAVSGIACWYAKAPEAKREGAMWLASVELVHAAEALAVAIADRDKKKAAVPGTVTIGSNTYSYLDTQPTGYDEKDTEKGLTIRKWKVSGFLTQSEWTGLLTAYNSWRDARFNDPDSVATNSVGTTISFSTTEPPAVSGVACWFTKAPQGTREGTLWNASAELVDAAQALAVALKQKDKDKEEEVKDQDRVDLGTYTIQISGRPDVVLTLTAVPDAFQDAPQLNLTAQGTHYLSGPTGITNVKDLAGYTDATGWSNLQYWYAEIIKQPPARNSWFPITPPKASAENIITAGLKVVRYNITLTLAKVR